MIDLGLLYALDINKLTIGSCKKQIVKQLNEGEIVKNECTDHR